MSVDACAVYVVSFRVHDTRRYVQIVMREVFDVSKRLSELELRESRARGEREGIEMSNTPMLSPAAATRSALSFGSPVPTPKASPPATEPVTCRCGGGATCCFQAVVDQVFTCVMRSEM
jgi:hypothetical protein